MGNPADARVSTLIAMPYAFSPLPQDIPESHQPESPSSEDEYKSNLHFILDVIALTLIFIPPNLLLVLQLSLPLPAGPVLRPDTFSVSNFTISNSQLAPNWGWDADFSFRYPSAGTHHDVVVSAITGTLYYNANALSVASSEPTPTQNEGVKTTVHLGFSAANSKGNELAAAAAVAPLQHCVADQISKEGESGRVHFTVKIGVRYKYNVWDLFWTSDVFAHLHCWDLVVKLDADTGKGKLVDGGQKSCPLSITY